MKRLPFLPRPLRRGAAAFSLVALGATGASWVGCGFDAGGIGTDTLGDASTPDVADTRVDAPDDVPILPDAPSCSDGLRNGDETDFDCGGARCAPCAAGQRCLNGLDCETSLCAGGVCVAPGCTNGAKDGTETDLDCGGGACAGCADGKLCVLRSDCASAFCRPDTHVCAAPTCSDGFGNAAETDVDCGGGACPKCATGKKCAGAVDCATGFCNASLVCATPSCTDGAKNQTETDVDCGGSSGCSKCATGKKCAGGGDCASAFCNPTTLVCATPTCSDGFKNGVESDVDCGGTGSCPLCADGKKCAAQTDCVGARCRSGSCGQPIGSAANPGASCAAVLADGSTASGIYWLSTGTGPAFQAYCDQTVAGGGWIRVLRVKLGPGAGCTMNGAAQGSLVDPADGCAKLSDAAINNFAASKVFFSRVDSNPPLFTRFDGSIRFDGPPGRVAQSLNFSDVSGATPAVTPHYAAWVLFQQQDWYAADRCAGAQAASLRLSLEYLSGPGASANASRYACTGACDKDCSTIVSSGFAEVLVK